MSKANPPSSWALLGNFTVGGGKTCVQGGKTCVQRWRASGGELSTTAGQGVLGKGFGVSHWVNFWAHTFMALVPQLCSGTIVKRRFMKACCLV